MPTQLRPECCVGAILKRADPCAGFSHTTLPTLPRGLVIGTSSIWRIAHIRRHPPPDHQGHTRRHAVAHQQARFPGMATTPWSSPPPVSPASASRTASCTALGARRRPGRHRRRGVRGRRRRARSSAQRPAHPKAARACLAERALSHTLDGGRSAPIGVEASWRGEKLPVKALVAIANGKRAIETGVVAEPDNPENFGCWAASGGEEGEKTTLVGRY